MYGLRTFAFCLLYIVLSVYVCSIFVKRFPHFIMHALKRVQSILLVNEREKNKNNFLPKCDKLE
jgi:hypothetical protein